MRRFHAAIHIAAPQERIWRILTDAAGYPAWNTVVDKVEGSIAAGRSITVHTTIKPGPSMPFIVKVAVFEPPRSMVWTGGMPFGLFKGERTFLLAYRDGGVEFSMTEVFSGLLAPLIAKRIPDLQPAFDEFAACLKRAAEQS